MADSPILPGQHAWRLVPSPRGGQPDLPPEFFRFFRELVTYVAQTQGNTASLTAILARLDALEAASTNAVTGQYSVQTFQQDAATIIRLLGDIPAPAIQSYYGTNEDGNRGWYQRLLSTLADVDVTTPPEAGDALIYDGAVWKPGSVDTAVPFFVPDGQSYTVAANKQALFTLPIELDGDASLVLDGALVEVS